eukprot:TRINITY_DN47077_c0_g1_i1.p1 TRINITY_DN47077_c0_g1~~TRINITY_DN47077_c0_g1_i1.p1  ORF type:complete len:545 (+),score=70.90 TRINITY_DN47077_c0_g1_i1:69-1637(+)
MRGRAAAAVFAAVGGGTVAAAHCPGDGMDPRPAVQRAAATATRAGRCVTAVGQVVLLDYHLRLRGLAEGSPERDAALHAAHRSGAERLLRLCEANKGCYVKIGQLLGQMVAIVPDEYIETLRVLFDAAPVRSIDDVRAVITAELGAAPEELFMEFDPVPIAAASLAQVHKARLHSGEMVAVKVQHLGLLESAKADVATVTHLVDWVRWLYPNVDYRWLADEGGKAMADELDFKIEAANTRWAAEAFKDDPVLRVPSVHRGLSGTKVLTMSFEEGVPLHEPDVLAQTGLRRDDILSTVTRVFHDMVFKHGMVHADPHPGNLLVRKAGTSAGFELVLLDHGLYRRLPEDFQDSYATLWWALVRRDPGSIREACVRMGMEEHWHFFSSIVSLVPWKNGEEMGPSEVTGRSETQEIAQQYFSEISATLAAMPREMALVLKTRDALHALGRRLGARQVTDDASVARAALRRIHSRKPEPEHGTGVSRWLTVAAVVLLRLVDMINLEIRLLLWAMSRRWRHYKTAVSA